MVWHVLRCRRPPAPRAAPRRVGRAARSAVRRSDRAAHRGADPGRLPDRRMLVRGPRFHVDQRVLIPRSPIAELIERALRAVGRGVARASRRSTWARVRAASPSPAPGRSRAPRRCLGYLAGGARGGARNIRRLRLGRRVRAVQADHFRALGRAATISSSAIRPTSGAREMQGLPPEFRHEPRTGAGRGRRGAGCGAGDPARGGATPAIPGACWWWRSATPRRACDGAGRELPFTWLEFERGGGGVFLLTRAQLLRGGA